METGAVSFTRAWTPSGQSMRKFWFPPPHQATQALGSRPVLPPHSCQGGPCGVQLGAPGSRGRGGLRWAGHPPSRPAACGVARGAAPCASVHIRPVRAGARAQLHPTQRFETSQLRCLMVLGSVPKQVPGFPRVPAESPVTSSGSAGCPPSSAQPPSLSSRIAAPSLCSASCHVASDPDSPVCHLLGPLGLDQVPGSCGTTSTPRPLTRSHPRGPLHHSR